MSPGLQWDPVTVCEEHSTCGMEEGRREDHFPHRHWSLQSRAGQGNPR